MKPLRVLIVEDAETDAALLEFELERLGYAVQGRRVDNANAMLEALEHQPWDLVIADYVLPGFDGLAALALVQQAGLDLPFIVVSGHITENAAVAAMKAGAHDYVMKDNLARLGPAVERELREARGRRERRRAEEQLRVESAFRQAVEQSLPAGVTAVDLAGRQTYVNPAFCRLVGWSAEELIGSRPPFVYWPPEAADAIAEALASMASGDAPPAGVELCFCHRQGRRFEVLLQGTPLCDDHGNPVGWAFVITDISDRKAAEARLGTEHTITRILAQAHSLDEAGPELLHALLQGLQLDLGMLWRVDAETGLLRPRGFRLARDHPHIDAMARESCRFGFARGVGLPGRVWLEEQPVWITDLAAERAIERREMIAAAGLCSAMAFPLQTGRDFFGVLEFFSARRLEPDSGLMNMMGAIGSEVGQFIHRRAAEEGLRRAHDELERRVKQRTADLEVVNARLQAAIAERRRLENELLEITEQERRRIGLDLHDDLGQKLSGIALLAKGLQLGLAREGHAAVPEAAQIHALVQEAMSHARGVARDLAALDFEDGDLGTALAALTRRAGELFGVRADFRAANAVPSLDPECVKQLYKIAQEALTNAMKHGRARNLAVSVELQGPDLVLQIQNDGLPFPALKSQESGMGLRIMNYRASLIGASLRVESLPEGGTLVCCRFPVPTKP
jgi:PAS domain S-box-containing protein